MPAAPDAPPVEVLMKGFLKKKSPKGLPGMHAWQMRWFELTAEHITYWEISMEGEVEEKGAIEVVDLAGVRPPGHQRSDAVAEGGREQVRARAVARLHFDAERARPLVAALKELGARD